MQFLPDHREIRYLRRLPGVRVTFSRWITSIGPDKAITIASCRISDPYVAPPPSDIPSPAPPPPPPPAAPAPPAALSPQLSTLEPSSVPPSQPFPPVERYSGQREGEEMEAFFLRRQEKNALTAAREKPQEKQRREQKEANAQKGQVPGRKGARVFVWEKSNGHYMRRAAGRSNYDDVWEEYGPEQRRYDSFHDEWDVCEQFGAPAEVEDWDGSDGYGGQEDDDELHDVVLEPSAAHTSEADLDRVHPITPISATESQISPIAPTFKEMVYLRYGCTVTKEPIGASLQLPPAELPPSILAKKLLGDTRIEISNENQMEQFRLFLAYSKRAHSAFEVPHSLLDFHQKDSELYSEWAVRVCREILNGRLYYVISDTEQQPHSLSIVVQSATTAMEIVRQGWGPSATDVMENLLSRGMSFMTCCRSTVTAPAPAKPKRRSYTGLGFRPLNYKPDMRDYRSYVAIRQRFLSSSRGRAALLYGGIVGRLARDEASKEDVFRGPSDDALVEGVCLWDGHARFAYWDDCLTEQEIDLICGVYHVATGRCYSLAQSSRAKHPLQVTATPIISMVNKQHACRGGRDHWLSQRQESTLVGGHRCGRPGTKSDSSRFKAALQFLRRTRPGNTTSSWNEKHLRTPKLSKNVLRRSLLYYDLEYFFCMYIVEIQIRLAYICNNSK
ncbi:hypothetical protein C8R47DRAFT_993332 [Mycena vitilis]|nr:hypothetical protein C8R47DRAFT_993332 [Mycena vitilis]